ncbi:MULTISPECIES: AraC family transcriptional regulator [unclassified Pedobacter]|uniref:AraC family transcriptional regulator n=1 Tax=unclassified Pedobacter TaxID=2628915 RepID=UPI001D76F443|nr:MULTISPECIES: AraC family transcriptional regulator [unclassified Pedobacter]CAH0263097.1 putative HTH-type transcriptional regulator Rv1395 [Pedobacter sp. Bi36]CAH0289738.1 putative HTH-type transcriptional regulator Rv1395 [Pedobacter sp. Bi126]
MEDQIKNFISKLIGYAVQRDISAEKLLRASNITIDELTASKNPLTAKQIDDVWFNAVSVTRDNLFGLHFGESLQLQALGIVGEIIKTSSTVGEAVTNAAPLAQIISASVELRIFRDDHHFSITFVPANRDWAQDITEIQTVDLLMVLVIHELDGLLFKKLYPSSVSFARSLDNLEEYERVLRCRPEINAKTTQISFDIAYWNERIIRSKHEHQQVLLLEEGLWQNTHVSDQALKKRIYNYIWSNSYLKMVTLKDIACNFNLSPRTLQRKLKNEEINFQQLADEARKNLALMYLKDDALQIKEISTMLGYNEVSAFIRAFKRWTGAAPTDYQKNCTSPSRKIHTIF